MSFKRLKEKEKELMAEIEVLIQKAHKCDEEEDIEYKEKTGYEIPEDLKFKKERLVQIQAAKEALVKREEELNPGKPIDDKKQISFADFEARIMGKKGSGFGYQYNGQICVDEDCQIIVAQFISQNVNDKKELKPAINKMLETTGKLPSKISADNGYMSADNLEALEAEDVDGYMATNKGEKKNKIPLDESNRQLTKSDFNYNEQDDCFTCPGGQTLSLKSTSKDGEKTYQGSSEACSVCKYKNRCCKSKKGEARTISTDDKEPLRQKMNKKMEQESSKEIYKQRKVIVEPVFGQIKNTGFRGFSVRGLEKTSGEFSLVCTVHNIKKIMRAVFKGLLHSESGRLEKIMV